MGSFWSVFVRIEEHVRCIWEACTAGFVPACLLCQSCWANAGLLYLLSGLKLAWASWAVALTLFLSMYNLILLNIAWSGLISQWKRFSGTFLCQQQNCWIPVYVIQGGDISSAACQTFRTVPRVLRTSKGCILHQPATSRSVYSDKTVYDSHLENIFKNS